MDESIIKYIPARYLVYGLMPNLCFIAFICFVIFLDQQEKTEPQGYNEFAAALTLGIYFVVTSWWTALLLSGLLFRLKIDAKRGRQVLLYSGGALLTLCMLSGLILKILLFERAALPFFALFFRMLDRLSSEKNKTNS